LYIIVVKDNVFNPIGNVIFSFENETSKVRSRSDAEKMQLIESSLVLKDIYFPLHPAYLPFDVTKGGLYQNFSDI
jgi:hypothetical protein